MLKKMVLLNLVVFLFGAGGYANADYFVGLGDLPGGEFLSRAWDISGDGSVVVGTSASEFGGEGHAFRWTQSGGMQNLGYLQENTSWGAAVSGDGGTVVGDTGIRPGAHAMRWNAQSGMTDLGFLSPTSGLPASVALAASGDGSVIVGGSTSSQSGFQNQEAFQWRTSTGMVGLGDLAGGDFASVATGISADGAVVVGNGTTASGGEAFRWDASQGMVGLGALAGGSTSSAAAVSADGTTIVGNSASSQGTQAYVWTETGGMIGLGDLAGGGFFSQAVDVSADGRFVVGSSSSASGFESFLWTETFGMISLLDLLEITIGLNLNGWSNLFATAISDDGAFITGWGTNSSGRTEAFLANIDSVTAVPEPVLVFLLGAGCLLIGIRERRKRNL